MLFDIRYYRLILVHSLVVQFRSTDASCDLAFHLLLHSFCSNCVGEGLVVPTQFSIDATCLLWRSVVAFQLFNRPRIPPGQAEC